MKDYNQNLMISRIQSIVEFVRERQWNETHSKDRNALSHFIVASWRKSWRHKERQWRVKFY